jgi:uncharacterized protein YndB with AHSA1/START domain
LVVTTPTDREIVLRRAFDAPRPLVFEAWTTPELLMRWYGARGWNLVECEVDLRVGGRWRFVSRGPGGARMGQSGVYREVVPPERLVLTEVFDDQSYPGESLVTHVFAEERGRTTLTSTVLCPSREARDIVLRYPMARGVAEGYRRLARVLAEVLRSRREPGDQTSSTRREEDR